jgi:erythromycin esterase
MPSCPRPQLKALVLLAALGAGASLSLADDDAAARLAPHVSPLRGSADLAPVIEFAANRQAVLLGEASHGTHEFYTLRAALSRELVSRHGFRFIAVEGDWGAAMAVNRYIQHREDAPESAAAALASFTRWPQWLWDNAVILELVEWLREYNAGLPAGKRVGFYGIDVYGVEDSMTKAVRYLALLDADAAADATEAYDCLARFEGDFQQYLANVTRGASCADGIAAVVETLRRQAARWRDTQGDAWFHAKQNALVVKNAERHYRKMIAGDHTSWNARAAHFHLTLERLLEHYGEDSSGIVWAHNTHIGDARATAMAAHGLLNIGQLARESLGHDAVALVGFGTHRGEVLAGSHWDAPRQVMPVPPAAPGSVEDLLHAVSEEPFLFLNAAVRGLGPLDGVLGHRAIGVTYDPRRERSNYVPTLLTERYDAFIFVPISTSLR